MVAIFTFVDMKRGGQMMVVLGDLGGDFGFLTGGVDDFLSITHPAALWLVSIGFWHSYIVAYFGVKQE